MRQTICKGIIKGMKIAIDLWDDAFEAVEKLLAKSIVTN